MTDLPDLFERIIGAMNDELLPSLRPGVVLAITVFTPDARCDALLGGQYDALDPSARFPLASVTKHFVAAACTSLAMAGEFPPLQSPIRDVLPEMQLMDDAGLGWCTFEEALSMSSGLPEDNMWAGTHMSMSLAQLLAALPKVRAAYPRGRGFAYSNVGFGLVGEALKRVTGCADIPHALQKAFPDAGLPAAGPAGPRPTGLWQAAGGDLVSQPQPEFTGEEPLFAAGGLTLTMAELGRWGSSLLRDKALLRRMGSPRTPIPARHSDLHDLNSTDPRYGLGIVSELRPSGTSSLQHYGSIRGFSAHIRYEPFEGVGLGICATQQGLNLTTLTARLLATGAGGTPHPQTVRHLDVWPGIVERISLISHALLDLDDHPDRLLALCAARTRQELDLELLAAQVRAVNPDPDMNIIRARHSRSELEWLVQGPFSRICLTATFDLLDLQIAELHWTVEQSTDTGRFVSGRLPPK